MILHFAQRLRTDGETFMYQISLHIFAAVLSSQSLNYTHYVVFRPALIVLCFMAIEDSQDERITFGNGNTMLKMRR